MVGTKRTDADITPTNRSSSADYKQVFGENRRCLPTGYHRQFNGYADRVGRGGRGHCYHPLVGVPVCRNRKVVMSRLINPIVDLEFSQIITRARKLPPGAEELSAFLKTYVARWAGRAGVLY